MWPEALASFQDMASARVVEELVIPNIAPYFFHQEINPLGYTIDISYIPESGEESCNNAAGHREEHRVSKLRSRPSSK